MENHPMPKVQDAQNLVDTMTDEELNLFVDYIRYTMKERARRRNALAQSTVKVGDKVRFAGRHRPQYLIGLTGVVEERRQTRVVVKLDCGPVGKFRSGRVVAPPHGLEVI